MDIPELQHVVLLYLTMLGPEKHEESFSSLLSDGKGVALWRELPAFFLGLSHYTLPALFTALSELGPRACYSLKCL